MGGEGESKRELTFIARTSFAFTVSQFAATRGSNPLALAIALKNNLLCDTGCA